MCKFVLVGVPRLSPEESDDEVAARVHFGGVSWPLSGPLGERWCAMRLTNEQCDCGSVLGGGASRERAERRRQRALRKVRGRQREKLLWRFEEAARREVDFGPARRMELDSWKRLLGELVREHGRAALLHVWNDLPADPEIRTLAVQDLDDEALLDLDRGTWLELT